MFKLLVRGLMAAITSAQTFGYFLHKTVVIPHDHKIHRQGEDAAQGSENLLVVADGVGGWSK
jgi:hypothetical protein